MADKPPTATDEAEDNDSRRKTDPEVLLIGRLVRLVEDAQTEGVVNPARAVRYLSERYFDQFKTPGGQP